MAGSRRLDPALERAFFDGLAEAEAFFRGEAPVQHALKVLVRRLEADAIPYAVVGGLALNAFGYRRVTRGVDVLLTKEGLRAFKDRHLGLGYVERFPGSRGLRDTEHDVAISIIVSSDFPGDAKPKPVAFPDPADAAVRREDVQVLALPKLIELKLASGMTAPHRLRDLADVLELIKAAHLPRSLADDLSPYVRDRFLELWQSAQEPDALER